MSAQLEELLGGLTRPGTSPDGALRGLAALGPAALPAVPALLALPAELPGHEFS